METVLNILAFVTSIVASIAIIFTAYLIYIKLKFERDHNKFIDKYCSKYVDDGRDLDQHWSKLKDDIEEYNRQVREGEIKLDGK